MDNPFELEGHFELHNICDVIIKIKNTLLGLIGVISAH